MIGNFAYELSDSFVFVNNGEPKTEYSTDAYDQLVSLFNVFVDEISGFQDDPSMSVLRPSAILCLRIFLVEQSTPLPI